WTPAFTATAVLAVALGIGLNTGVFSILNGLTFRKLPVPSPDQLVSISQDFHGGPRRTVHGAHRMFSMPEYQSFREGTQTLSGLMGYSMFWNVVLNGEDSHETPG